MKALDTTFRYNSAFHYMKVAMEAMKPNASGCSPADYIPNVVKTTSNFMHRTPH